MLSSDEVRIFMPRATHFKVLPFLGLAFGVDAFRARKELDNDTSIHGNLRSEVRQADSLSKVPDGKALYDNSSRAHVLHQEVCNTPVAFGAEARRLFSSRIATTTHVTVEGSNADNSDNVEPCTPLTGLTAAYQAEQQLFDSLLANPSQDAVEIATAVLLGFAKLCRKSGVKSGADLEFLRAHANVKYTSPMARFSGMQGAETWDYWIRGLTTGDFRNARNFVQQRLDENPSSVFSVLEFPLMPMGLMIKANKYTSLDHADSKPMSVLDFLNASSPSQANIDASKAFVENFHMFIASCIWDCPHIGEVFPFRSEESVEKTAYKLKAGGSGAGGDNAAIPPIQDLNYVEVKVPNAPGKPAIPFHFFTNGTSEQNEQRFYVTALLHGIPMKLHLSSSISVMLSVCKVLLEEFFNSDGDFMRIEKRHWIALGGVFTATLGEYHSFVECSIGWLHWINFRFGPHNAQIESEKRKSNGDQLANFGAVLNLPDLEEMAQDLLQRFTIEELRADGEKNRLLKTRVVANLDSLKKLGVLLVAAATRSGRQA